MDRCVWLAMPAGDWQNADSGDASERIGWQPWLLPGGRDLSDEMVRSGAEALTACPECDLLLREAEVPEGGAGRCPRCAALLFRNDPGGLERALALSLAALVVYVISNIYPIVGLEVNGDLIQATMFGTVRTLYDGGMVSVALLFLFTAILAPLLHLLAMTAILLPLRLGRRLPGSEQLMRLYGHIGHWAMVEVFVLGVLVSLVKLAGMASVIPGIALASFGALMILSVGASAAFDPRQVWASLAEAA